MIYSIFKITLLVKRHFRRTRAGKGIEFAIKQQVRNSLLSTLNCLAPTTELRAREMFVRFFREHNKRRGLVVSVRNFFHNVVLIQERARAQIRLYKLVELDIL